MSSLLLTDLITEGLAANDRVKYYLTLLQAACAHALQPFDAVPDLRGAREASGVRDAALDRVVPSSRQVGDGVILIPGAQDIRRMVYDEVRRMLEPLAAIAPLDDAARDRVAAFRRRLDSHAAETPPWADDRLPPSALDAFTSGGGDGHDTIHRLVMDLHRELNRLLAGVAAQTIGGARAMGTTPEDRPLISAFMTGVNATIGLKFDHPGLGTTAARAGDCLSIQNDLGTTDGHLVVIRVTGLTAATIYSDVHGKRLRFFQDLLQPYAIAWQPGAAADGQVQTIVGSFTAGTRAELEQFLTFAGSRLVFLIDWNKARKCLGRFVKKADAIGLLRWAADNNVGHRAFLQAGGAQLICTAFERIATSPPRFGARLDELIGPEAATAFLQAVLRIAATGLGEGRSVRLVQDEVEAELLSHLESADRRLLDVIADHAMLLAALTERLRAVFGRASGGQSREEIVAAAAIAKAWETRADDLVRHASRTLDRTGAAPALGRLLDDADDVADALEETAFVLTLMPEDAAPDRLAGLSGLADLMSEGARHYVRAIECARDLPPGRTGSDLAELLVCIDRIAAVEQAMDAAERTVRAGLLAACTGFRELQVLCDIARGFEQAADRLARCGLAIRDHALGIGVARS